jgi:signal transduction histidine kinase
LRFATNAGVVSIDPAQLPRRPAAPPIVLEPPLVDGVQVKDLGHLQLPSHYKRIQFNYAALNLSSPDKVIYRTQLYGFDQEWSEVNNKRSVSYTRLPPGRYEFRVTARSSDGPWSETPAVLAFEVPAAFWQTGWFTVCSIILFIGLGASVVRYIDHVRMRRKIKRLEQVHALERERVRIARDLHDSLGARLTQMAFASDIAAADSSDSQAAQAQFRDISKQARLAARALDETVWMVDPHKDSLPHFVGYCGQYANDFFRRTPIACRQLICASPPDYPLAGEVRHQVFSAVKEVLNNVLKHADATEVWMGISMRGNELYILIRDNGRGFVTADADPSRRGLGNLRSRMEAVGGSCVLRSKPGRGTRVLLRVTVTPTTST